LTSIPLVGLLLIFSTTASLVPRKSSSSHVIRKDSQLLLDNKPWTASGANVYWLGLDENVIPPSGEPFYAPFNASYPTLGRITEVMNTLDTMGATALRGHTLGVSVGNPLSVMPELGKFNEEAFETIDWAVYEAGRHGIKIFAPLIDNYDYYHGGKFDFLRFRGIDVPSNNTSVIDPEVMQFYTNKTIINDFKSYIEHLITHRNKFNGLTYAEDPTIFAYETGNELGGPMFGDMDVPVEWTDEIATFVKSLAPEKLVIDGTYGINKTHLSIGSIDIMSDHFYPLDTTKLENDIALVGSAKKVYFAGEYNWSVTTDEATVHSFFSIIEAAQNSSSPVVKGDHFWSLFMHDVPDCTRFVNHTDGLALQYGNPENSQAVDTRIEDIRTHLFKMQGVVVENALPKVACPGPS
jgi:mannan endo-1,4-beta-mannosidase